MAAVAHNSDFARRVGIPQKVGKDFNTADAGTGILSGPRPHHAFGGGIGSVHIPKMAAMHSSPMSSSQGTPWWTRSEAHEVNAPINSGFGSHGHFAAGGMSMSQDTPWWTRSEARIDDQPFHGGLINSAVAGRTDRLPLNVPSESHVIPADAVSSAGQGSTQAGSNIWQAAISHGPFGVPFPKEIKGHGPPAAPHPAPGMAEGGSGPAHTERTSILAAGGEMVIPPEDVEAIGQRAIRQGLAKEGETALDAGHRLIDEAIKRVRDYTIQWMKKAPPPKKSEGGQVGGIGSAMSRAA